MVKVNDRLRKLEHEHVGSIRCDVRRDWPETQLSAPDPWALVAGLYTSLRSRRAARAAPTRPHARACLDCGLARTTPRAYEGVTRDRRAERDARA